MLSSNVHRVVSTGERARYGETPLVSPSHTFLIYFTIPVYEISHWKCRKQKRKTKKYLKIYSLYGFYPLVVIIHKCYRVFSRIPFKNAFRTFEHAAKKVPKLSAEEKSILYNF